MIFEEQHAAAVARAAAMEATDLLKAFELKNRARAMTVQRLPFMYNGENVMLQLPYVCEWLAGVPELAAHYGSDFQWRRNPFLRGVTLDERAVTPRKATRSYKLGDEVLEEVVESLMAARREEEAALKMMQVGAEREEAVSTRGRDGTAAYVCGRAWFSGWRWIAGVQSRVMVFDERPGCACCDDRRSWVRQGSGGLASARTRSTSRG